MSDRHQSRAERRLAAREQAAGLVGLDALTVTGLLDLAAATIGAARTTRVVGLIQAGPLTRRAFTLGYVAALVVGTTDLGRAWWGQPHEGIGFDGGWTVQDTPDAYLAAAVDHRAVVELGSWVEDAAADARWGRPIDFVDLNDPRADDRVRIPDGAHPGDQFVAAFDPGYRVPVRIVERTTAPTQAEIDRGTRRGALGSVLSGENLVDPTAEADWATAVGLDEGPVPLPSEHERQLDPFATPIAPAVAERLRVWAMAHGASVAEVGRPWDTKGDLWAAVGRIAPMSRPGRWFDFARAAEAVVDGALDVDARLSRLD